jgi:hypothetical protein
MRSPVHGSPRLFASGDDFAFLYRPYELDSWPDEALRVQRINGDFTVTSEPLELLGPQTQNGAPEGTAVGGSLAVAFRPQDDSSATVPHLVTADARDEVEPPVQLSTPSANAGQFTVLGSDDNLFWAWVDLGPDYDPATLTGGTHRMLLQPIDREGAPTGPQVVVAELGSVSAINLSLKSRRVGGRLQLTLARQDALQGVGAGDVHAALLACEE